MNAEDRIVHFATELIHAPTKHAKAQLQQVYYELAQTRAGYDNIDFNLPGRPRLFSVRGRSQSIAAFLPDRVALVEEWADVSLPDFLAKIREVGERALRVLSIPAFAVQVVTLRCTSALTHFPDARVFLLDRVCGLEGQLAGHFHRPIGLGGIRLVFPRTPEHRGDIHVAIESFRHGLNEVVVEIRGTFAEAPIARETLGDACHNVEHLRAFVTESVYPFLNQYDAAREEF